MLTDEQLKWWRAWCSIDPKCQAVYTAYPPHSGLLKDGDLYVVVGYQWGPMDAASHPLPDGRYLGGWYLRLVLYTEWDPMLDYRSDDPSQHRWIYVGPTGEYQGELL